MLKYKMNSYQIETTIGLMWVVEYPALPGVVGSDVDLIKAIQDLEVNALAQIEFLKEDGLAIPEEDSLKSTNEYNGRILVRTSKSVHRKLSELSTFEGVSLNSLVNDAINRYIGGNEAFSKRSIEVEMFIKGTRIIEDVKSYVTDPFSKFEHVSENGNYRYKIGGK